MQPQTNLHQPYPGLRPYLQAESDLFFGRAEQVNHMLTRLEENRFLAVVGSSGSGKSSLVRAGLLPALLKGYLWDTGTDWKFIVMKPGDDPFYNLAMESVLKTTDHPDWKSPEDIAYTQAMLSRPNGFLNVVEETYLEEGTSLLLLVDQFEEIFRFRTRSADTPLSKGERPIHEERNDAKAFVNLLLDTVEVASRTKRPIYVVITMRSDFIGGCEVFPNLPQAVSDSQFLVPRMTLEEMQEAIEKPLLLFDCRAERDLVNQILNDAGSVPDQLPLMQHALMRTWFKAKARWGEKSTDRKLTLRDYDDAGGILGALSQHLDEAWKPLTDLEKQLTQVLFLSLCERNNEGQLVRRPVKLCEIAEVAQVSCQKINELVKKFQEDERNFIVASPPGSLSNESVLDISHEALLRQWGKLRDWLERELESADGYKRLAFVASQWQTNKANLLSGVDLAQAEEWRKNLSNPTPSWAKRYDPRTDHAGASGFDLVLELLENSKQSEIDRQEALERDRLEKELTAQRELISARKTRNIMIGCFLGSGIIAIYAMYNLFRATVVQARMFKFTSQASASKDPSKSLLNGLAALELQPKLPFQTINASLDLVDALSTALTTTNIAKVIQSRQGPVWSLVLLKNGNIITGGGDGTIRRWKSDGTPIGEPIITRQGQVLSLLELSNGNLVSGGVDGSLQLWGLDYKPILNSGSGKPFPTNQGGILSLVQLNRDEIITGGTNGTIRRWKSDGTPIGGPIKTYQGQVLSIVPMPNGEFYTGGGDGKILRWRNSKNLGQPIIDTVQPLRSLAKMQNGDLITASVYGIIRRWNSKGTPISKAIDTNQGSVRSLVELNNGDFLTAGTDGTIVRWQSDGTPMGDRIKTGQGVTLSLVALPSGDFYGGGSDGTILRWNLSGTKGAKPPRINHEQLKVTSVLVLRNGEFITGGTNGTIRWWKSNGWPSRGATPTGQGEVTSIVELKNGNLVTGGSDGTIRSWKSNGTPLSSRIDTGQGQVIGVLELSNGKLITGGQNGILRHWNNNLTPHRNPIRTGLDRIYSMIRLKNGELLIGGSGKILRLQSDGQLIPLIDTSDGAIGDLNKDAIKAPIFSLVELRDGQLFAGGGDGMIRRWSNNGKSLGRLKTKLLSVLSMVESKNGVLIAGGEQGLISLWRDGKPVGDTIETGLGSVSNLAILNGGDLIASGSKNIRLWQTQENLVKMACTAIKDFRSDSAEDDQQANKLAFKHCGFRNPITTSFSKSTSSNQPPFPPKKQTRELPSPHE